MNYLTIISKEDEDYIHNMITHLIRKYKDDHLLYSKLCNSICFQLNNIHEQIDVNNDNKLLDEYFIQLLITSIFCSIIILYFIIMNINK